jgi:hypothetical protein
MESATDGVRVTTGGANCATNDLIASTDKPATGTGNTTTAADDTDSGTGEM